MEQIYADGDREQDKVAADRILWVRQEFLRLCLSDALA